MAEGFSDKARGSRLLPFLLPVGAAVILPALLLILFGARFFNVYVQVVLGVAFSGFGLFMITWTITLFRRKGKGSLAPWNPTRKLVVEGPYAHTRNPMITGVFCLLLGEAILCGSAAIMAWALLFFIINTLYFKLSEEPGLLERFGEDYREYRANVPMWLPRFTARKK
jgi:protein-S-isoprenylcysteine O-methyltransferase Ste14